MLQSIRNFTKGKLSKVLLVILIIPFVLWGMGDVFRGGSQTTIATLNDKRISITDYINHFNSLNVSREFIINNPETKIFEIGPNYTFDFEKNIKTKYEKLANLSGLKYFKINADSVNVKNHSKIAMKYVSKKILDKSSHFKNMIVKLSDIDL